MASQFTQGFSAQETMQAIAQNIERVIRGKSRVVELVLTGLVGRGHVLIEDVPGVGKTILVKSLARSIGAEFRRIQFTPDLLPSDITGTTIYRSETASFEFRPGPVFTNILLGDELNRATPRTQSSLLEAMEEHQVTVDGQTHSLPKLFFVIATQNPLEQEGVYPLPEAQLDRFLMQLEVGYPPREDEISLVRARLHEDPLTLLSPVATLEDVLKAQEEVKGVHVDATVIDYALRLVEATRQHEDVLVGASPRASLALVTAARALAYLRGRTYTLPDDVKEIMAPVLRHRLILQPRAQISGKSPLDILGEIRENVALPLRLAGE